MSTSPAMPRHVVILAHPDPHSFNATIADTYRKAVEECGQAAVVRDLYALKFDPVLRQEERPSPSLFSAAPDVRTELDAIACIEVLTLIYPVWFGAPPAILKGYIDRVMGYAVSPASMQSRKGNGLLQGTRLLSITTSAARAPWLAAEGQEIASRNLFDHYLASAFGMIASGHVHFGGIVPGTSERFIQQYLYDVKQAARDICAKVRSAQFRAAS